MKARIARKLKALQECVVSVEKAATGLAYPPYYVEPVLSVVEARDNVSAGLGVLYARTLPLESRGRVGIVVQVAAPLLLYGTKASIKTVMAHEFMHYVDLVARFSMMDVNSELSSSSVFEERYADMERLVDPVKLFTDKRLLRQLGRKLSSGLSDEKLNEKCRAQWIEKGMPTARLQLGANHVKLSAEAIMRTEFDPRVKKVAAGAIGTAIVAS